MTFKEGDKVRTKNQGTSYDWDPVDGVVVKLPYTGFNLVSVLVNRKTPRDPSIWGYTENDLELIPPTQSESLTKLRHSGRIV